MIDIISADAQGLGVFNTQTGRAANILSTQQNSLEYAPDLGIDLSFFLSDQFRFQDESFKAYLIERLASNGINVSAIADVVENLFRTYTVSLTPDESSTGFIAR